MNAVVVLSDGDVLRIHGRDDSECVMDVTLIFSTSYPEDYNWTTISLTKEIAEVSVGREQELALSDRTVSRKHASFFHAQGGWALIDHGSLNGVYLNNHRIAQPHYLRKNDVVRVGSYHFFFTGDCLIYQSDAYGSPIQREFLPSQQESMREQQGAPLPTLQTQEERKIPSGKQHRAEGEIALDIRIEERNVWHRMRKKTLLREINMEIAAGSMVLILGGSGAGKTTFMNAVMGYEQAEGSISYKGIDIYEEYERMKYEIGYVPQQDLLRSYDTVYDTLYNAAQMRLSSRLTQQELEQQVKETMHQLGLEREAASQVSKLSGGQRKRLSIAVEYISNPSLFFLDEPDSGLDGTMARSLMEQLRSIADSGKIVLVITHSPDRAFELFDQVIVLAKGSDDCGHLAFYGSPEEACSFFSVSQLEQIVKRINRRDEGGEGLADEFIRRYEERRGQ